MHDRFNDYPFSRIVCHDSRLEQPLHHRKPALIGVCFMGDLFHEDVPEDFVVKVFHVMYRCSQHYFIVLTKRPQRMAEFLVKYQRDVIGELPNVGVGVSVENQETADERIPWLLKCPAAMKFVSVEPMLGSVDLHLTYRTDPQVAHEAADVVRRNLGPDAEVAALPEWKSGIDWVVIGCESGPGARPMDRDWVWSIRDECIAAQVPFFFKQRMALGKRLSMPFLGAQSGPSRVWDQYPEAIVNWRAASLKG
jgi:protein gp37